MARQFDSASVHVEHRGHWLPLVVLFALGHEDKLCWSGSLLAAMALIEAQWTIYWNDYNNNKL